MSLAGAKRFAKPFARLECNRPVAASNRDKPLRIFPLPSPVPHQKTKMLLFMFGIVATANATSGTRMVDSITFGDVASEKSHAFSSANSEIIKGGPGESARKLLPLQPANWQGY
jgi:hypothetical protein